MHKTPMTPRRGLSLLEVMVALTILGTALIGMAEYGRRFAKTNANAMTQNTALDIATDRLERVKAERNYTTMDTLGGTHTVIVNTGGVNVSYTRTTTIVRTLSPIIDYKTVTVSVTRPTMATPVKKTSAVPRF
ncbi:MAG: prepilin-type N-terminal cleavage/methylation domain-containing protein [Gemmatimonadetes bacterium]|nr:prepilin-type N-terminal cleavage/methylation domain-containing protein [Gemmatimonadota bacterium]